MSLASDKRQSGAGHSNNSWRDVKTKSGKETRGWGGGGGDSRKMEKLDFTPLKEKNVFLRECGLCAASSSSSSFSSPPPRLTWGDTLGGAGVVVVLRGCEGCGGESKKKKKAGSWKWPSHVGNNSALRSERTHKRPHYLGAAPLGPRRRRALTLAAAAPD